MKHFAPYTSVLALGVVAAAAACTVSTNDNTADGGTSSSSSSGSTTSSSSSSGSLTDSGTSQLLGFTPSNLGTALEGIDTSLLGDVDKANAADALETGTPSCAGQPCIVKTITLSNGSSAAVYIAKSWKLEPTAKVSVTGNNPLILVALTTIDILGKLDASAERDFAVGGGFTATPGSTQGAGAGTGQIGTNGPNGTTTTGGGGGSFCGIGGKGGNATATIGGGGPMYGTNLIVPLQGGSTGGNAAGTAGGGGGAIQLVAGTSINIGANGFVLANGGGGATGGAFSASQAAGGGGSGGAILFEAPTVTVAGVVAANGGGGGGTNDAYGADGNPSAAPAAGGNSTHDPDNKGVAGGNGSGGATLTGANGDAPNADYVAGGGGGGAGWVRFNTSNAQVAVTGTVSPSVGSICGPQGVLVP